MRRIYLDHAAATPVSPAVFAAMKPYFGQKYGNPGSLHSFGQEAMGAVDGARERVARAINADFRGVVFTASATEANNLALRGAVDRFLRLQADVLQNRSSRRSGGGERSALSAENPPPKVIVSSIEHESVLETAYDLENEGAEVVEIPVDKNGIVDLKKLKREMDERTVIVSVMYVQNEIGSVQPIAKIAAIVRNFREGLGIENRELRNRRPVFPLLHTDASQAPAYFDCDVAQLGVDLMTLSSQKINGPKGVGALYVRDAKALAPFLTGGGQEHGLRSGTENVPGIVGFAAAMEAARKNAAKNFKKVSDLKTYFLKELKRAAPGIEVNGEPAAPHILNVYFPSAYAGDLLVKLDLAGIAASSGSACAARAFTPSHVLAALGLPDERIRGSVRFSLGSETTKNDLKEAALRIKRSLSN